MRKLVCLIIFSFIFAAPLAFAKSQKELKYDKERKKILEKRIPYWEEQLKKVVEENVSMKVDFESYPKTAKALHNLDFDVLSRIRGSFRTAASKEKDLLKGKVSKVNVKHDEKAKKSSFKYDEKTKTLDVTTSPNEKWWIDADKLVSLLQSL